MPVRSMRTRLTVDEPPQPEALDMIRQRPIHLIALFVSTIAVVAACGGASGPLGSVPRPAASAEPSVDLGSPDITPTPTDEPSDTPQSPDPGTGGPATPTATPSSAPAGTTVVRSYFWLGGLA